MKTTISFLKNDHLAECAKLYISVFSQAPWNQVWSLAIAKQRLLEIFQLPRFIGIGCFDHELKIQGFAIGNSEYWLKDKKFYLKEMCVNTALQGQGIGKVLIEKLKQELLIKKISKMYLLTQNDSPAQRFYLDQGFINSELIAMSWQLDGDVMDADSYSAEA